MNSTRKLLLISSPLIAAGLVGLLLLIPSFAQSGLAVKSMHDDEEIPTKFHYSSNVQSLTAYADFYEEDEEEGIETYAGIYVTKSSTSEHSMACLYLFKQQEYGYYDEEYGEWYPKEVFSFDGCSEELGKEFTMKGRFASAKLTPISITGYDYYGYGDMTLVADASWVGVGEVHTGTDRYVFKYDNEYSERYTSKGTYRLGTASLNITMPDGEKLSFESEGYDEAHLSKNHWTEMYREHY